MINKVKLTLFLLGGGLLFGAGVFVGKKQEISKITYCGTLRIDRSLEDEPQNIFLELEIPVESLSKTKTASFKISNENYILRNKNNPYNEQK